MDLPDLLKMVLIFRCQGPTVRRAIMGGFTVGDIEVMGGVMVRVGTVGVDMAGIGTARVGTREVGTGQVGTAVVDSAEVDTGKADTVEAAERLTMTKDRDIMA